MGRVCRYASFMNDFQDEDKFITQMVIAASTVAAVGLLTAATLATVMVSANFNILQWME